MDNQRKVIPLRKGNNMRRNTFWIFAMISASFLWSFSVYAATLPLSTNPPDSPVKLIFIHHSCGENWLADSNGGLGLALRDNNYFVSDTYYGWGPDDIGDFTDIGQWYDWFVGPNRDTYLSALYSESGQQTSYSRMTSDPGGENQIIMFKSCFPNSYLGGNPNDPPTTGSNPLAGQDAWSVYMTVANAKGIYNQLLDYFAARQDKLFVVITAPPLVEGDTDAAHAANARAFNDWLVNDWLANYTHNNVAVFDFFNVLTSNGGNTNTNDLGEETGNHHRWWNNSVQHIHTVENNFAAYASASDDSHPTAAGNRKATEEYTSLLNVYYNCWKGTGGCLRTVPSPVADIKVNGSNGPLTINHSDTIDINISVDNQGITDSVDWWLAADTPFGTWFYLYEADAWTTDWMPAYQGNLFNLLPFQVLSVPASTLSSGHYTLYFGVDTVTDGEVTWDKLFYDTVDFEIE